MDPKNLPEFQEFYTEHYNPLQKSFEIRRKSRTEGNLNSMTEVAEYISAYLRKYQMVYSINNIDKTVIFFPFMFIEPKPGDKIRNLTTNEVYTVVTTIKNPETNRWEGLVKLSVTNSPLIEELHALDFIGNDRVVRFEHEVPDVLVNQVGANLERLLKEPPPMQPTVTWTIKEMEPGTLGSITSSKKEWKPRLRESYKDPFVQGHTIEVWGQRITNTVQFNAWSNDPRTSDRLIGWFEQFMRLYTGQLRLSGCGLIIFLRRSEEDTNQVWRQAYNIRGSQYHVDTEILESNYIRDILKIDISLESQTGSLSRYNETRWIADQMVSGELTPSQYRALFFRSGEYLFGTLDIKQ